ncbi:hypothetical protein VN1218_13580 [Helicobacter pylori]|nr:hypothetical protein VN1218_13580 [Helicobacter pylori]
MLFKTYQKLLGASCLALYLMGCGSGGGAESPVEITANSEGSFQIRSKADSVTIQGVKLNRGNCVVNFVLVRETVRDALSQVDAGCFKPNSCFKPNGCSIKSNYSNFYARF